MSTGKEPYDPYKYQMGWPLFEDEEKKFNSAPIPDDIKGLKRWFAESEERSKTFIKRRRAFIKAQIDTLTKEQKQEVLDLAHAGKTLGDIMREMKISLDMVSLIIEQNIITHKWSELSKEPLL